MVKKGTVMSESYEKKYKLFLEIMADNGLIPHMELFIEVTGKIKRFRAEGDKSGSKNGWYVLFDNGFLSGAFGNWKTGLTRSWCDKRKDKISKVERLRLKQQLVQFLKEREKEKAQAQQKSAIKCGELWNIANQFVKAEHPYLISKNIKAFGIRQLGQKLLIPVQDVQSRLVSLQFIMPDGSKVFQSGGKLKGCFNLIGELKETVFICEGYATGVSIHEATGKSVIVAFFANNLSHVVTTLKAHGLNKLKMIIVADNDHLNINNTGLDKASECAELHNLPLIYPTFNYGQSGSDFNDLAKIEGLNTIGDFLIKALKEITNEWT